MLFNLFKKAKERFAPKKSKETPLKETPVVVKPKTDSLDLENAKALLEAKNKAQEIILEAKNEALELRKKADTEFKKAREESFELEKSLEAKKAALEQKEKDIKEEEEEAKQAKQTYLTKLDEISEIKKAQIEKLEKVSSLTKGEAKKIILEGVESQIQLDIAKKFNEAKEELQRKAEGFAKEILVDAMHKAQNDYVSEYTISKVKLADEDMKGRIIGKEGRNIKAFEELTGVNVELDETPNEIRLSCFDSVRREIARISLEKLISDGRIHPPRIEEVVKQTKEEIEKVMFKAGEELCQKAGVYSLPKEIIALLGRFKYRFSYGQNMLEHTLEEVRIGTYIAGEIKANVNLTKLACLLHDIGKAVSEEEEGTHIELGVKILKKHQLPQEVIDAVAEHHNDKFSSVESVIVQIADSISGSRPGARYADYGDYVSRMRALEETAKSFKGVIAAYAISAGREVRVIVEPKEVPDIEVDKLAFDVAKKVESEHTYPGTVKVTVIRDYRAIETAK